MTVQRPVILAAVLTMAPRSVSSLLQSAMNCG